MNKEFWFEVLTFEDLQDLSLLHLPSTPRASDAMAFTKYATGSDDESAVRQTAAARGGGRLDF